MARYLKCPYCGKEKLGIMAPRDGKSWVLVEVDANNNQSKIENVMNVDVFACTECHSILLKGLDIEEA